MDITEIKDLIYEKEPNGICTLTINAPERRNAMTPITFLEIMTVLDDMEKDKNTKVLIITGSEEGRAFSSGGYFNFKELASTPSEIMEQINLQDIAQKKLTLKLWDFSKPIIAVINGLAIGAGITMPLIGADLIYMTDNPEAYLGFYFAKRAVLPEFGSSYILPFYVGFQKAKEIIYFAEKIFAKDAEKLGIVNKVLPEEKLMAYAREQAMRLLPPNSPLGAIRAMKKLMHGYFRDILSNILDDENKGNLAAFKTRDFREATRSLSEKRAPVFKGK
ncbi:MAG: enoyl-CoA hydratase/isomerase family protein [Promethearchaeota archaeon]